MRWRGPEGACHRLVVLQKDRGLRIGDVFDPFVTGLHERLVAVYLAQFIPVELAELADIYAAFEGGDLSEVHFTLPQRMDRFCRLCRRIGGPLRVDEGFSFATFVGHAVGLYFFVEDVVDQVASGLTLVATIIAMLQTDRFFWVPHRIWRRAFVTRSRAQTASAATE